MKERLLKESHYKTFQFISNLKSRGDVDHKKEMRKRFTKLNDDDEIV